MMQLERVIAEFHDDYVLPGRTEYLFVALVPQVLHKLFISADWELGVRGVPKWYTTCN